LLNNATEAVSENSGEKKIHIGITTAPPHQVHIQVTNNGPSITPEVQEKMFVPFYTTKKNGSGIGLSICQEIIKLHKGSLSVASVKEGHTAFIVEV
jgi:signal transduction histidine kinase